jgi:hypothetical protein
MLNPWLALSIQAARLGWATQNVMIGQLMRMAVAGASDRSEAGHEAGHMDKSKMALPANQATTEARTLSPLDASQRSEVTRKASSSHKKRDRGNKRRR